MNLQYLRNHIRRQIYLNKSLKKYNRFAFYKGFISVIKEDFNTNNTSQALQMKTFKHKVFHFKDGQWDKRKKSRTVWSDVVEKNPFRGVDLGAKKGTYQDGFQVNFTRSHIGDIQFKLALILHLDKNI